MAGGSDFITDAVWWLWTWCSANIPGARLGGIYANKSGYHNTVTGNRLNWPGDYSIQLAQDLKKPIDKARAFDLTLAYAEMVRLTGYLKRAAEHPLDNRLDSMREFYGTLDGVNVFGLIHDGPGQAWSWSTSDSSHLWHIHHSFFTDQVNNQAAMEAVASVLAGVTWEQWAAGGSPAAVQEEEMHFVREPNGSVWWVGIGLDPATGKPYRRGGFDPYIWGRWQAAGFQTVQLDEPMQSSDWVTLPSAGPTVAATASISDAQVKAIADSAAKGAAAGAGNLAITLSGKAAPATPTP